MKIYKGKRFKSGGENYCQDTLVTVSEFGKDEPLTHHVYHSPDGFNWGYGGSGPADLARSILWDHLGKEPSHSLYQDFKFHFVSGWKDEWEITSEEIQNWMDKRGSD